MELQHELTTVIRRMYDAGWPTPAAVADTEEGRDGWADILEALAERYLQSTILRVDTLIQLGPLAATDLAGALDIAGWEGEAAVHAVAEGEE